MEWDEKHLRTREDAMRTETMGKVIVTAKIENVYDLHDVSRGSLSPDKARAVEVTDALVDTGATTLSLPKRLIGQLGVQPVRTRTARTSAGRVTVQMYGIVKLTIQGRDWSGDVAEVPDDCPVLIGQLPLEGLDFVVDPINQRLIGNPEHGGEHIIELY
jgi:clan AA aspartic protease